MYNSAIVVLSSIVYTFASSYDQCSCPCFKVPTLPVGLEELRCYAPLYSQAASVNSSEANTIDSVCLFLNATNIADNALWQLYNVFIDGSRLPRAGIQLPSTQTGCFDIVGPTRRYRDCVLGSPCEGTYVIYSCIQTESCMTDRSNAEVIIISTRMIECQECIDKGIDIALEIFPDLTFFVLPRESTNPCSDH
uniref:Chitin-binding type-2 domain-containing protein n=1 Tax=Homalodisca liturata TaxID=320908 RepID=A0A1B6K6R2_9HEMI